MPKLLMHREPPMGLKYILATMLGYKEAVLFPIIKPFYSSAQLHLLIPSSSAACSSSLRLRQNLPHASRSDGESDCSNCATERQKPSGPWPGLSLRWSAAFIRKALSRCSVTFASNDGAIEYMVCSLRMTV